jgi:hypothetical protein
LAILTFFVVFNGDFRVNSEYLKFNEKLEELREKNPEYKNEKQKQKKDNLHTIYKR